MQKILHVSDNPEHFSSIGSALAQIPANNTTPVIIEIAPGIYHEKLTINKPYITLRGMGESSAHTVISYDDYALDLMEDGSKRGTFRTYTLFIDTHDVTLQHLTIENVSGDSATHGQAIALYADGDRLMIDSCRLLGHQDTLFTGPLPEKERQPGGFIGPKQFAPRINGRQYYKNCYICGDIDFIFGSATAYFEHCTLESLLRTKTSAQSDLVSTTSTLHDSGSDTFCTVSFQFRYGSEKLYTPSYPGLCNCRLHTGRPGIRLHFFRLPVHLQRLSCRFRLSWQAMARLCKNDPDFL